MFQCIIKTDSSALFLVLASLTCTKITFQLPTSPCQSQCFPIKPHCAWMGIFFLLKQTHTVKILGNSIQICGLKDASATKNCDTLSIVRGWEVAESVEGCVTIKTQPAPPPQPRFGNVAQNWCNRPQTVVFTKTFLSFLYITKPSPCNEWLGNCWIRRRLGLKKIENHWLLLFLALLIANLAKGHAAWNWCDWVIWVPWGFWVTAISTFTPPYFIATSWMCRTKLM